MMADDIISFNEARAEKEGDGRLWTPLECLKALVRDLENGACNPVQGVYVALVRKGETGEMVSAPFYVAGLSGLEIGGLLAHHLHNLCERYE